MEFKAVSAHLINIFLDSSEFPASILMEYSYNFSSANRKASFNPLMIIYECIPSSIKFLLSFINSPARRVTEVVPSPTSLSYDLAISTRVLAAGWTIFKRDNIVAPSLEIVVLFSVIILSIPLGPKVVLTTSTTA